MNLGIGKVLIRFIPAVLALQVIWQSHRTKTVHDQAEDQDTIRPMGNSMALFILLNFSHSMHTIILNCSYDPYQYKIQDVSLKYAK